MTAPVFATEGTATLRPHRDARLLPYCLIAFGGLLLSVVTGQPGLATLSAPFLVAVVLGLRRTGPVRVTARITVDSEQLLEGDIVRGRLALTCDEILRGRVMLHRPTGVTPTTADGLAWPIRSGIRPVEIPIELRAIRWGRHALGEIWVRLEAPFGLFNWTGRVTPGPTLRILPDKERLNRLVDPPESRAVWGMHRSLRLGDGHEFAETRPYVPGDRLRDLNWNATARYRRPFVNRRHPELSGDLLIAIDAVADGSESAANILARVARIAWALADVQMRANDRVGILGMGGSTQWLAPAGGRLARYRLLEALLRIGGDAADRAARGPGGHRPIPPSTLIIALSPLHDERTVGTLTSWRARGRSVAVVMIGTGDLLPPPSSTAEALARRVWQLELGRRRDGLTEIGVPVVVADPDSPVASVVSALRRVRRGPWVRR